MKKATPKFHAFLKLIGVFLPLLFPMSLASAQAIKTFACPDGSISYRCIASNETCGWRNERPTAAELEEARRSAERNAVVLMAPCPTLPSGIKMELCWIDRNYYCKAPSPADIARAEQAKREREEKARQERLAAERKQAEIARETARLGAHREAEARRLVEMREAAAKARGGIILASDKPAPAKLATKPADKDTWTLYIFCSARGSRDTVNAESAVKGVQFYVSTIKVFTANKGESFALGQIDSNFNTDVRMKYGPRIIGSCNSGNTTAEAQTSLNGHIARNAQDGHEIVRTGISPRL